MHVSPHNLDARLVSAIARSIFGICKRDLQVSPTTGPAEDHVFKVKKLPCRGSPQVERAELKIADGHIGTNYGPTFNGTAGTS
jgi:hypothetical protein